MFVGMIQSNYLPWRGYFDFIASVDCFVLYDDVAIGMGRTWRNRNRIKTMRGLQWLTVPIRHDAPGTRICDVRICYQSDWIARHCGQLTAAYRPAPYFKVYFSKFRDVVNRRHLKLSTLNEDLIRWVMDELGIGTTIVSAERLNQPAERRELRPLHILKRLEATAYLTGPNTLPYTSCCAYMEHGIRLRVKDYTYAAYRQLGDRFEGAVTILDLLFNMGPEARHHFRAHKANLPPPCPRAICDRTIADGEKQQ